MTDLEPITREEMFLAAAGGQSVELPEPITREEVFLKAIADGGGGGGGGGGVTDVKVNGQSVVSGGVANVPIAQSDGDYGLVKLGPTDDGLRLTSGKLGIQPAVLTNIKAGTTSKPIIPGNQHSAAFYGLATAAGDSSQSASSNMVGTYTDEAKSKIHEMLSGSVSVTGSTPAITALPGIRYSCGEVSTLDITLPDSGCVDVTFVSGSTPTVLTVTPPTGVTVKWANGFDPTSLDANTTYEINIADGLGVAVGWT